MLPGPVSGNFWQGQTSYSFTTGDQNSIVATARTIAIAQTPAGKQFYRLTFDQAVLTGKSTGKPMSTGIVTARTYYGKCITDVSTKTGPGKQQ
jgi:hypothetical protein